MLYRGLARRGPLRLRRRLPRRTPPNLGQVAGPRCKVEMAALYGCLRSCHGGPRHRYARAIRAGRRPPPRGPHMAGLPADSTSARMGCRAFLSILEVTLGLQPSMRYHGARTRPRPTSRRQAIALRFPDSQDLPVSFPLAMQVTMYLASSGSVPSDRRGRREITYQRSGDRWPTLNHQGWVECLTGPKGRHQVTKSQGAAKHSSQA